MQVPQNIFGESYEEVGNTRCAVDPIRGIPSPEDLRHSPKSRIMHFTSILSNSKSDQIRRVISIPRIFESMYAFVYSEIQRISEKAKE